MNGEASGLIEDWPQYLTAAVLVMVRLSGLMVFAPVFSSSAIAPRIKAGFVYCDDGVAGSGGSGGSRCEGGARYAGGARRAWRGTGVWTFADRC